MRSILCALLVVAGVGAQSSSHVQQYFQTRFGYDGQGPDPGEHYRIALKTDSASEISVALPSIAQALRGNAVPERTAALETFFVIAHRPDGADLIKPYLPVLLLSLRDADAPTTRMAAVLLGVFRKDPGGMITNSVLSYFGEKNASEELKAGLAGTLVTFAPSDPRTAATIRAFLDGKPGANARGAVYNEIANSLSIRHQYSAELVQLIANAVENDPETRYTSVQALGRCGWRAYGIAVPVLMRVAQDESEKRQIRDFAQAAMDTIGRSTP